MTPRKLRALPGRFRASLRASLDRLPADALPFAHITVGFALLTWGLEAWSVWRVCFGVYVLYWVGLRYLWTIGLEGIYILRGRGKD